MVNNATTYLIPTHIVYRKCILNHQCKKKTLLQYFVQLCSARVSPSLKLCFLLQHQSFGVPSLTLSWTSRSARRLRSPTATPGSQWTATLTHPVWTVSVWVSSLTSTGPRPVIKPGKDLCDQYNNILIYIAQFPVCIGEGIQLDYTEE